MRKSSFLAIIIATFFAANLKAQSMVDPGVSTHNYKHPQKAAKAKAIENGSKTIRVANINTVEAFYKMQNRRNVITTPKYAPRPATLVVTRSYESEGNDLNPLLSPRNYKTPTSNQVKRNWEVADFTNSPDSTAYPTVD